MAAPHLTSQVFSFATAAAGLATVLTSTACGGAADV